MRTSCQGVRCELQWRHVIGSCLALAMLAPGGAQAVTFDYGVACGAMSSTDAVLWTRTSDAATLTPELVDVAGATIRSLPPITTTADADFTVKTIATDLPSGAEIRYRFRGPAGELSPVGQCRTAPPSTQATELTFGFSGDVDWKWRPYPLLSALNAEPLDFFVFLGDTIYETTNLPGRRRPKTWLATAPSTAKIASSRRCWLAAATSRCATCTRDSGSTRSPTTTSSGRPRPIPRHRGTPKVARRHLTPRSSTRPPVSKPRPGILRVSAVARRTVPGTGDPRLDGTRGYYFSQPWGSAARLIVADDRSYRDVRLPSSDDPRADDPARTMLGAPQLAWLEQELSTAQTDGVTWKIVVISSPIQHIGRTSEVGADIDGTKSWAGGYRVERDRLLKFIADTSIDNVVFLTTDNHYTMINNLRYRQVPEDPDLTLVPARNAFEILTGPLGREHRSAWS